MAAALRAALEGLAQVHAGVEAGHLLGVAVERQRRAASDLADPSLRRLAPARMVDRRVHVRGEAVLAGRREVPRGRRLGLDEADAHDRLDALEPVLPRDDEAERRAVLVRQRRRVALVGAELVEVVVGGDVAVRRARLGGAVRPVPRDGKLGRVTLRARRLLAGAPAAHEPEKASADAGARRREERGVADELAPPQVHRLRRDIRGGWGRSELRHVSPAIQVRTARWNAPGSWTNG